MSWEHSQGRQEGRACSCSPALTACPASLGSLAAKCNRGLFYCSSTSCHLSPGLPELLVHICGSPSYETHVSDLKAQREVPESTFSPARCKSRHHESLKAQLGVYLSLKTCQLFCLVAKPLPAVYTTVMVLYLVVAPSSRKGRWLPYARMQNSHKFGLSAISFHVFIF